ncbi:lactonase family protein [Thalassoglobus sp.]|uniref:lactonase family protein n=1 Tax=Thalassoglobus sp. TaxID=2795869 RepID=UPI003AA96E42
MKRTLIMTSLLVCLQVVFNMNEGFAQQESVNAVRVYVGTYTRKESKGIYTFTLNPQTGETSEPELAAELTNPSFVAISPSGKFLYAVNEVSDFAGPGQGAAGGVTGFQLDAQTGKLTKINSQSSGGPGACHLTVDQTGKCVLVANYGGGSVASLPIDEDGSLKPAASLMQHKGSSVNERRQKGPHAHSVNVDAANKFAVVADLGLDQLLVYKLNAEAGTLTPNDPAFTKSIPGGGPRHLSFHPNGKLAFANNEMLLSVTAYNYDANKGVLTPIETYSTVPEGTGLEGNSTAETLVHPSGKFLYVSNRGPNSIAMFRIRKDGTLEPLGYAPTNGEIPRGFGIDPTGNFLLAANQNSDTVVVFRIDQKTGKLSATGTVLNISTPVNVRMLAID